MFTLCCAFASVPDGSAGERLIKTVFFLSNVFIVIIIIVYILEIIIINCANIEPFFNKNATLCFFNESI